MRVIAKEPITYGSPGGEVHRYAIGDALDIPDDVASQLIAAGAAEASSEVVVDAKPVKGKSK